MFADIDDEALVNALAEDNDQALAELFDRYWTRLYRAAYHLLSDDAEAQDVVQEIFINLWKRRHELTLHASVKSYLFSATRYRTLNRLRERMATNTRANPLDDHLQQSFLETVDPLLVKELEAEIEQQLQKLPNRMQAVLKLTFYDQLTVSEIALRLNISEDTVRNHLAAARQRMRRQLGRLAYLWLIFMIP